MLKQLKVGTRLGALLALPAVCMIIVAGMGLFGQRQTLTDLRQGYEDDTQSLRRLGTASMLVLRGRADAANGLLDAAPEKHAGEIEKKIAEINTAWADYSRGLRPGAEKTLTDKTAEAIKALNEQGFLPVVQALKAGNVEEARRIYWEKLDKLYPAARDRLVELQDRQVKNADVNYAGSVAGSNTMAMALAVMLAVSIVLVLALGIPMIRGITRPVLGMKDAMLDAQRSSDLTVRLPIAGNDEIAQSAVAFNALMESLQRAFRVLASSANAVSSTARNVAAASVQITESSQAQAESAAATAAAVEEVTVSINQVADNSKETREVAETSSELSAKGEKVALAAAQQMATTADSVAESARLIENLSQRSNDISGIVKVISEIAEQTNLLALNAAIEAARAGEQGRGFAVVADEVRKLAERTSTSTSEISGMIEAIQNEVRSAVNSLKLNNDQVGEGREQAKTVAGILSSINQGASQTMDRIKDISHAAAEQGGASNEIARNFERIAQTAEETSAAIAQASQAAVALENLAQTLHAEVARFKA